MARCRRILALSAGLLASGPALARAFTVETLVSEGCHERMLLAALSEVGWPGGQTPPELSELERRVVRDLTFDLEPSAADPWTLAALVGVRDNDLRGVAPSDLPGLSEIHTEPALQLEHCLRSPADDGAPGDARALGACRRFVLRELALALGEGDDLDLESTVPVPTYLAFRERTELRVRRFGFHLGRAIHAVQDSYAHAFRAPEVGRVRHVLNFTDFARSGDYHEARDGHRHLNRLDDCDQDDPASAARARAAEEATTRLLRAVVDETGGRAGRLARAALVLDSVLALEPGCTADNRWCDAPELSLRPACDCRAAAGSRTGGFGLLLLVAVFGLLRRARAALAAVALVLAFTGAAQATPVRTSTVPPAGAVGFYLGASAAIDRGAFAGAAGVRWRVLDALSLGADVEWNPWFSLDAGRTAPGALNLYATGIYHWVSLADLELRTTAHLGTSVLLFDLVGADAGATGLYLGLSLLGLAARLDEHVTLIFEPADLAFPVPQLRGVPFYYHQYRITLGVQWNP